MCLVFAGSIGIPNILHAFKLQQRPDIGWLFCSDVILKEHVALSKFGSPCYRQILDF